MIHKEITIVCVSYQRYAQLPILIHSVLTQTLSNWKLCIWHDGPDEKTEVLVKKFCETNPEISYFCTPVRYNDYGHSLRQMGLDLADTEFVMFTNDDNYYVPRFLEYMFASIRAHNLDLVLCNMIHSHKNPGVSRQDDYLVFETQPRKFFVDIGCFILRTELAKAVGFRERGYNADGVFIEDVMARFKSTIRVGKENRILYVHN